MPKTETVRRPGEQLVVTEDGVRRDGEVYVDEDKAKAEADRRRRKLQEQAGGEPAPKVEVKRQLFG